MHAILTYTTAMFPNLLSRNVFAAKCYAILCS